MLYFPMDPLACLWFLDVATFSMIHLFLKDGLLYGFVGLTIFYLFIVKIISCLVLVRIKENINSHLDAFKLAHLFVFQQGSKRVKTEPGLPVRDLAVFFFYFTLCIRIGMLYMCLFYRPPTNLPDLMPVLVASFCCCHFVFFLIYFNYKQILQKI